MDKFDELARRVGARVMEAALSDPHFRQDLRELLRSVLNEEDERGSARGGRQDGMARAGADRRHQNGEAHHDRSQNGHGHPAQPYVTVEDLRLVARRCELKAEAARWCAERVELIEDAADYATEVQPRDHEIIRRAKELGDCFLWMSHPSAPEPERTSQWNELGSSFEVAAEAIGLLEQVQSSSDEHPDLFEQALELAAESQCALRDAVGNVGYNGYDDDQRRLFLWLRQTASEQSIYLSRFMRLSDHAEPSNSGDLSRRIREVGERLTCRGEMGEEVRASVDTLLTQVRRFEQCPDEEVEEAWSDIAATTVKLVDEHGLEKDHVELRGMLDPLLDDAPEMDGLPQTFEDVLDAIDTYEPDEAEEVPHNGQATSISGSAYDPAISENVARVRQMLQGCSVVLIGGDARPQSKGALEQAFGLKQLLWVPSKRQEPSGDFRSYIDGEDVAMVLMAARWSSYSLVDVQQYCEEVDKPLVRLNRGYAPDLVAGEILNQVGDSLESFQAAS